MFVCLICGIRERKRVPKARIIHADLKTSPTLKLRCIKRKVMLKKIIYIFLVCFSSVIFAQQESGQFIHKHLVRVDASIVPGFMFKNNLSNVYINGNAEYYLDNRISFRGDMNYLMGSTGLSLDSIGLKDNHSVLVGAVFHIQTKGNFDPYIIIQPGITYASSYHQTYTGNVVTEESKQKKYYPGILNPIGSAGLGFNYYFQRFAHLFFETRYIYGNHLSESPSPLSLQELRVTFGLGFNLFIIKEKKNPV